MRKFLEIFSVNDPGWGNGHQSDGSKDAKGSDSQNPGKGEADAPNPTSENKPAGDNRPSNGPPDLDELWRDFNDRITSLFGGKKGSSNPGSDKRNGGGNAAGGGQRPNIGGLHTFKINNPFSTKTGIYFAVSIMLVAWLASGFFIIQEGQAGVILTFGKYDYTTRPGINWRMPWPIQSQEVVNLSGVRSVEVGRPVLIKATNQKDSSMLTEDENIIDVRFAVQYRLKDPTDYLFNNRDPDMAVIQAAETAVREIVARSKMDTVLYEGREKIAIDLASSIQRILDSYKTGIYITSVTVQNVQPPEQVQAAFDDAVKAGQDQERLKSEGQAYANDIIPRAKGTGARLIQEAEGYKARVVATAEGDATRFKQVLVEYAKAPQVTRDRMYIDSMREMYNNVTKVLVDTTKSNSLLYLPLDKIVSQVSAESSQITGNPALSSQSPTPSGSVTIGGSTGVAPNLGANLTVPQNSTSSINFGASDRSVDKRDGLRSRDRDSR